jgi:hypothetical protein
MIVTEYFKTRKDGVVLNRTYSDAGFKIERDGVVYDEAIDPADLNRIYTETNEPREVLEGEATDTDYQEALENLGVNFDE